MEKDIIIKGAREHNLKNINHLWRLIQFMQRDKEDT